MKKTYKIVTFTPKKWRAQAKKGEAPTVMRSFSLLLFLRRLLDLDAFDSLALVLVYDVSVDLRSADIRVGE